VCNLAVDPTQLRCAVPNCNDGALNGSETDRDCGGGCPLKCKTGQGCERGPRDCVSGVCKIIPWTCNFPSGACYGTCKDPSCSDLVQNGAETDLNCGGPVCQGCDVGKKCGGNGDCKRGLVCDATSKTCRRSCPDGILDGTETDVDCGGDSCPACLAGQTCKTPTDCATRTCDGHCRCPDQTFVFGVDSSQGTAGTFASWPGGEQMQEAPGTGCRVWIQNPDNAIHYVCTTLGTRPFAVLKAEGFSSCQGTGGDDGDGCGDVACNLPASYGQCCANRPSCSSALNGTASAKFFVECKQ
jgi:hypothetical protein